MAADPLDPAMKWESNGALDYRLVADDGEILERVEHRSGEYQVASTGKRYVSSEQAKKAAERRHSTLACRRATTPKAEPLFRQRERPKNAA